MTTRRAIIDIGSNTVRLVVYGEPLRAPTVLLNEKVTARLGREVAKSGMLADKAMATALSALARHAAMLRLMEVADVQVVATAAVRDAGNGAQFLERVAALGLSPRLLSGKEEARASALGVLAAFPRARGVAADLGGGSLELTTIGRDAGGEPAFGQGVTLPLGTLRLPELRTGGEANFARLVRKGLRDAGWRGGSSGGEPLFLVGGSLRALALRAMEKLDWPIDDPHGFEVPPREALRFCNAIARGKLAGTANRITASRLASLPDAAALLAVLVRELAPSRLVFSSWGLREGLVYGRLDKATRGADPMLCGVAAFVGGMGVASSLGAMVAGWTAAASTVADAREENLRLAACLLSLAAMRSEPNFRAEEATDWALRKRWIGIDARDRAMLASAVLANSGLTAPPAELLRLAPEAELRRAAGWGLAIRLCRKLTGATAGALAQTALDRTPEGLVLTLRDPWHALRSESVAKALRQLADWLGCPSRIDLAPAAG